MVATFIRILAIGLCCAFSHAYASDLTREEAKKLLGFMGCNDAGIAVLSNGAMPGGFIGGAGTGTAYVLAICDRDGKDVTEERTFIFDTDRGWIFYEKKEDSVRAWTLKGYGESRGPNWIRTNFEMPRTKALMEASGIVGMWSLNCAGPFRSVYAISPTPSTTSYLIPNKDTPITRSDIQSAKVIAPNQLEVTVQIKVANTNASPNQDVSMFPVVGEKWKALIRIENEQFKLISYERLDGIKATVRDEQVIAGPVKGQSTPSLSRCKE